MAEMIVTEKSNIVAIADAVRTKTGTTGEMTLGQMANNISNISGGSVAGVHFVTFMSEDGTTELYKRPVADGDDCADVVARGLIPAPTKESTAQYDYTHVGWATTANGAWDENALKAVTEDKTVYATFAAAVRMYTATFYDGDTVLSTQQVAYGSQATPPSTEKENHVFVAWNPADLTVTKDADFIGEWREAQVVVHIPLQDVAVSSSLYKLDNSEAQFTFNDGEKYCVEWDGVLYELTAATYAFSANAMGGSWTIGTGVGNPYAHNNRKRVAVGGVNGAAATASDEPFWIQANSTYVLVYTNGEEDATHTLKVYQEEA